jgi:hypothetical protein
MKFQLFFGHKSQIFKKTFFSQFSKWRIELNFHYNLCTYIVGIPLLSEFF